MKQKYFSSHLQFDCWSRVQSILPFYNPFMYMQLLLEYIWHDNHHNIVILGTILISSEEGETEGKDKF